MIFLFSFRVAFTNVYMLKGCNFKIELLLNASNIQVNLYFILLSILL